MAMMQRLIAIVGIAGGILTAEGPRASGPETATRPIPVQMAQRETDRLTRFFTLTTAQQSAVLGILTTANTQLQPIASQIRPLRTTLTEAIKSGNQGLISSTLAQISDLRAQTQLIRSKAASQIYTTVLTATQQAQVGKGLGPLMGRGLGSERGWGPRRPGRFGPGGPDKN